MFGRLRCPGFDEIAFCLSLKILQPRKLFCLSGSQSGSELFIVINAVVAKCWLDEQEADEAAQRRKTAKILKVQYFHGALRRISDRHKQEGRANYPERSTCLPACYRASRGDGMNEQMSCMDARGLSSGRFVRF